MHKMYNNTELIVINSGLFRSIFIILINCIIPINALLVAQNQVLIFNTFISIVLIKMHSLHLNENK